MNNDDVESNVFAITIQLCLINCHASMLCPNILVARSFLQ